MVLTVHYSKLTMEIRTAKKTAARIMNNSNEHLVARFGIPFTVLPNNGPQFVSNFFAALCQKIGFKMVTETEYYLQAYG